MKTCSFFGHRKVKETKELKDRLKDVIVELIENKGVEDFLFGSKSSFDLLCHVTVSELKLKYPHIKRKAYTCRSETCILEKDISNCKGIYSNIKDYPYELLGVEEEVDHKTKWTSGKAQYVERNQKMIEDSDFCVFYYDEQYYPPLRKQSRRSVTYYQPKSGTKIAYDYARQKKKQIINLYIKNNYN